MDQRIEFDLCGLPFIETTYKGCEGMHHEHEQTEDDETTDGEENSGT